MTEYFIFSDASFDPKSGSGICASLILVGDSKVFEIQTRRIDGETISRLEFIAAISALREWKAKFQNATGKAKITLIIDCKAIENLLERRDGLEKKGYLSAKNGKVLANADLYKKYFTLYDELRPEIVWVKGHSPKTAQSDLQWVFSRVDKMARKTLREILSLP